MQIKKSLLDTVISIVGFLPFIGWVVPLYIKKDNVVFQKNSKIALVLAFYVIVAALILTAIDFFAPSTYIIIFFVLSTITYSLFIIYFSICLYGAFLACKDRVLVLPVISSIAANLNI